MGCLKIIWQVSNTPNAPIAENGKAEQKVNGEIQ
jgi:hypothetical protein